MNTKIEEPIVEQEKVNSEKDEKLTCGIIMPIAGMGGEYTADHWADVIKILHIAIEKAGFIPRIVSDSEESTVIHGSIINNIYNDAIVVCDVSNKNANVMFELGMRLAFNKPVVIIKDDKTDYSFDTSNIQHENYRKDLRHNTVEKFINDLSKKIKKTYEASLTADYQSFLSYFGKFEVAKIENKSIGESEAIEKLLNKVSTLDTKINSLINNEHFSKNDESVFISKIDNLLFDVPTGAITVKDLNDISTEIKNKFFIVDKIRLSGNSSKINVNFIAPIDDKEANKIYKEIKDIIDKYYLPF